MILRSASSLDLNIRAAQKSPAPRCANGARVATTARPVSASRRGCKSMPRASSDGNLHEKRAIQSRAKTPSVNHDDASSSRVLERSRLHQGGSNGGFGGRGGDGGDGGAGGHGGGGGGGGSVDGYYEEMIQRYPGDALLLANYARFLKEVYIHIHLQGQDKDKTKLHSVMSLINTWTLVYIIFRRSLCKILGF